MTSVWASVPGEGMWESSFVIQLANRAWTSAPFHTSTFQGPGFVIQRPWSEAAAGPKVRSQRQRQVPPIPLQSSKKHTLHIEEGH